MRCLVLILCLGLVAGCGGSGSEGSFDREGSLEQAADPVADRAVTATFGQVGNIYKPSGDPTAAGAGNVVILLDASYTQQMDSCSIPLVNGERGQLICIDNQPWTQTPFSCFSNGNRQTWRGNFKCSAVGEVKVTCMRGGQKLVVSAPGGATGNVCTRFG